MSKKPLFIPELHNKNYDFLTVLKGLGEVKVEQKVAKADAEKSRKRPANIRKSTKKTDV